MHSIGPSCLFENLVLVILPFSVHQLLPFYWIIPISIKGCIFFYLQNQQNKWTSKLLKTSLTPIFLTPSAPCLFLAHKNFFKSVVYLSKFPPYILKPLSVRFLPPLHRNSLVRINNDPHLAKSDDQFQVLILFALAASDNIIASSPVNTFFSWCLGHQTCLALYLTGYSFSVSFAIPSHLPNLWTSEIRAQTLKPFSYLSTLIP